MVSGLFTILHFPVSISFSDSHNIPIKACVLNEEFVNVYSRIRTLIEWALDSKCLNYNIGDSKVLRVLENLFFIVKPLTYLWMQDINYT